MPAISVFAFVPLEASSTHKVSLSMLGEKKKMLREISNLETNCSITTFLLKLSRINYSKTIVHAVSLMCTSGAAVFTITTFFWGSIISVGVWGILNPFSAVLHLV